MSTESRRLALSPGAGVLVASSVGNLAVVVLLAVVALVASGADAGATVLTGGVVTAFVLAFGSWAVHLVAHAMPSASLVVALLTYALQAALLTAFLALVSSDPQWGQSISKGWLGASVITCVAAWVVLQVTFFSRARIPLYDLPSRDGEARR